MSCIAVIARTQELQAQTRDPLTAGAERAIRELEMDDDEGLWLLDVIQRLSTPKSEGATAPGTASSRTEREAGPKAADRASRL